MTAQTATIADFLLARIAEDEEAAEKWSRESTSECWNCGGNTLPQAPDALSPARVLAECEAKRRIVALHTVRDTEILTADDEENVSLCIECALDFPCSTLRLLALPYGGHPDYDAEGWAV